METLPKLIKANDPTVLVNGRPIPVDYRMVWEENYQELKKAFDMRIVGVELKEKHKKDIEYLEQDLKEWNELNDKGLLNNEKWIKHASFVKGKLSVLYSI